MTVHLSSACGPLLQLIRDEFSDLCLPKDQDGQKNPQRIKLWLSSFMLVWRNRVLLHNHIQEQSNILGWASVCLADVVLITAEWQTPSSLFIRSQPSALSRPLPLWRAHPSWPIKDGKATVFQQLLGESSLICHGTQRISCTHTHTSVSCRVTSEIWQLPDEATQQEEMEILSSTHPHFYKRKRYCSSFQYVRLRKCGKTTKCIEFCSVWCRSTKKQAQIPWCHVN